MAGLGVCVCTTNGHREDPGRKGVREWPNSGALHSQGRKEVPPLFLSRRLGPGVAHSCIQGYCPLR